MKRMKSVMLCLVAGFLSCAVLASAQSGSSYKVSVMFYANGGYGSMATRSVTAYPDKASYYTLPACGFKRTGYFFDGWKVENTCYEVGDESVHYAGSRIDLREYVDPEDCTMIALRPVWREAVTAENDWLYLYDDGDYETEVGEEVDHGLDFHFAFDSGSAVTLSVSGLPTGLKYDKNARQITGKTTRKGVYYVTCSAKNANGFTMLDTIRWIVGGADSGDYDNIGLEGLVDFLDELTVGEEIDTCLNAGLKTVTGLPTGLSFQAGERCYGNICTDCSDFIYGTPTKAGKFSIVFMKQSRDKAAKTVIVRDGRSAYLNVEPGQGYAGRGTVSGGGVKHAGATVKLSARAKSGCYFAGWYVDEYCTEEFSQGKSGDYRTANESFVFDANDGDGLSLYAKFVTKAEDADISIQAPDTWDVMTEHGSDSLAFAVDSQTVPKITAKGLPTGVKLSGTELVISDTSKLKPGTSVVTLTAKNLSGATATATLRVVVPNLQSDVFDGIDYEESRVYTVGVSDACTAPYSFDVAEGWTVTASGVPSGLKFTFNRDERYAYLSGMAKKAGTYTVTLTAKKGTLTEKATFTVEVLPFPEDAIGSYGGVLGSDLPSADVGSEEDVPPYCISAVDGAFTMTVAKDGKISAKFTANGKTVGLSGYACDVSEEYGVVADLQDAKGNACSLSIYQKNGFGRYQVEGWFGTDEWEGGWSLLGQRNVAKTDAQMKKMVTKLSKLGRIQGVADGGMISCPGCMIAEEGGTISPNITFTVGADGLVKASGRIEGRSVSGSALLQVFDSGDDYCLYADFCDYKATSGSLAYRAVFSWNYLQESGVTGANALYDGAYYPAEYWHGRYAVLKPVIYLYPTEETPCSVKVEIDGRLTCTYPAHGSTGWCDFIASPDGTLTFADGEQYYCLYWEGQMNTRWDFSRGYCVKGSETADFLADVLLKMGLTFREANEFIIYWLPQMQDNPYNLIAFQDENYANAARLDITPQPDSVLRIFMAWRPSVRSVAIDEPIVRPFERKGFTVVEWGGTKVGE